MVPINLVAVLSAAILAFILGYIWFGPLFGKKWMHAIGKEMPKEITAQMKAAMLRGYVLVFIFSLVMAYVLAGAIIFMGTYTNISGIDAGVIAGVMNWLGFIVPASLNSVLWEGRPWKYWFITAGYYLVVLVLMGVLLAVWA